MTTTQQTAHDAYLERYAAICRQIEALQQLAEDHFGHNPDTLHWGHVGDLGRVKAGLDDVLAIFNSGNCSLNFCGDLAYSIGSVLRSSRIVVNGLRFTIEPESNVMNAPPRMSQRFL